MYKLAIKFLILTMVLTGVCLMWSSNGKALAATTSCPSGDSVPADWGNDSDGEGAGVMSSLVMRARDDSGNPLNPHFTLTSQAPGWPDDAQIYHWPIGSGGSVSNTDNWPQHGDFQFGTHLSGDGGVSCNGWIALGPGIDGNVGNGWVLNCKNPSDNNNIFQITHVDNPVGQTGQWWLLDSSGVVRDYDVNSGGPSHIKFPVTNGANMRFTLVWHPSSPPTPSTGTCTYLQASLTGNYFGHSKRTKVEIQNTNLSGGTGGGPGDYVDYIPGPNGQGAGGSNTSTINRNYNYQPQHNSIAVTVTTQYYNGSSWQDIGGATHIRTISDPCFTAQCSLAYVDGDGPGGIVLAGHTMHIHGTYYNTSPAPDNLPIWNPALSASGSQNGGNNHVYTLFGGPAYKGYPYDFDIYMTAPNSVTQDNFSLTPIYFDSAAIGGACSGGIPFGGVPTYQQFTASVSAQSDVSPTIENPSSDNYGATISHQWVNPPGGLPGHGINNSVSTSFYQKKAGGGQTTPCSPSSYSSSGPYSVPSPSPPGYDTIWSHNCAIAPGSFAAGDEFCSTVSAQYSGGYVGPDNNVVDGTGPTSDIKCPRVVNEPYFKVYHSDISAGGDFDQCTAKGGTLAGYADISDPSGATRGSTTQLSALALLKITGVASAKTAADITGSPTKLTFANTGVQVDSGGNESPVLGGQFGGCRTLTNETAPASAKNLAGASTGAVPAAGPGAYTHTGNLTINGGTLGVNQNVSIFVTGNVYISNDITYGNGWQAGTAPSFILHATGNIYIAPGVTQLAGVYIAQSSSAGAGGKIYTCADGTGFAPMSAVNLYSGCKNQLVVYGSFVADQINLMRSFGSLRDEIPSAGSPGSPGAVAFNRYNCNATGDPALPYINFYQTQSSPPLPANKPAGCSNNVAHTDGYIMPAPGASIAGVGVVPLYYGHKASGASAGDNFYTTSQSDANTYCNNRRPGRSSTCNSGQPSIVGYVYAPIAGVTNNLLNSVGLETLYMFTDRGYHFYTTNPGEGGANTPVAYVYNSAGGGGASAVPPGAPSAPACSNNGGGRILPNTCAGEIFEYSPALYLSNGGGTTQPPNGGSLQLQSITSLPPVL